MVSPLLSSIPRPSPSLSRRFLASRGRFRDRLRRGGVQEKGDAREKTEEATTRNYCIDPQQTLVLHLKRQQMKPISTLKPDLRVTIRRLPVVPVLRQGDLDGFAIITQSYDLIARTNLRQCQRTQTLPFFSSRLHIYVYRYIFSIISVFYAHVTYIVLIIFSKGNLDSGKLLFISLRTNQVVSRCFLFSSDSILLRDKLSAGYFPEKIRQITKFMTFFDIFATSFLVRVLVLYFVAFFELTFYDRTISLAHFPSFLALEH